MASAAPVTLSCALLVADPLEKRRATAGGVFCVSFESSRLVGELKELVRRKKPRDLRHLDADALSLVLAVEKRGDERSWLSDEHDAALTLEIRGSAVHEAVYEILERPNAVLRATKPLGKYLAADNLPPPGAEQIHLFVVAPPAQLTKRSAVSEPEGEAEIAGKKQRKSRFQGDQDDFVDIVDVLDSDVEGNEDYHIPPPARRVEQVAARQQNSSPGSSWLLRDSHGGRDSSAPRPKLEVPTNSTGSGLVRPEIFLDPSRLFSEERKRQASERSQLGNGYASNPQGSGPANFTANLQQVREVVQNYTPLHQRQAFKPAEFTITSFANRINQARERKMHLPQTAPRQVPNSAGSTAERPIELLDPEPSLQPSVKTEFVAASAICSSVNSAVSSTINSAVPLKSERLPTGTITASYTPSVIERSPFDLNLRRHSIPGTTLHSSFSREEMPLHSGPPRASPAELQHGSIEANPRLQQYYREGAAAYSSFSTDEMFARLSQYDTEASAETSGDGSSDPSGMLSPRNAQGPPAEPELLFSDEQTEFIRLAVEVRRNMLLVAPAGYGKSAVINRIMTLLKDSLDSINDQPVCGLCAPTGKAASLIKGRTLHSYLGIGLGRGSVKDWVKRVRSASFLKPTLKALRTVQVILIDEISMVSAQMLDRISEYLQEIRMNMRPFGGVQMILVGDLCQLPPVEGAFMFRSLEYARAKFHAFQFTKCFRQNDPAFVNLLNEVRFARCTEPTLSALRKCTSIAPEYANGLTPMMIVSTNKEVDTINERELNALIHERSAEVMTYSVRVSQFANPKKADAYRRADGIPELVKLSVGCQVVVTQNIGSGIVNGTQGCVTAATSNTIELRLQDNNTATIEYFPYKDPEETDVFLARTLFSYMPVRLGYASTVHKAQGMTLQLLEVDVKRVFAHGQLYTALSRVTDLRGLIVKNLFPGAFICNEAVREFYKDLGKGGDTVQPDTRQEPMHAIPDNFFISAQ